MVTAAATAAKASVSGAAALPNPDPVATIVPTKRKDDAERELETGDVLGEEPGDPPRIRRRDLPLVCVHPDHPDDPAPGVGGDTPEDEQDVGTREQHMLADRPCKRVASAEPRASTLCDRHKQDGAERRWSENHELDASRRAHKAESEAPRCRLEGWGRGRRRASPTPRRGRAGRRGSRSSRTTRRASTARAPRQRLPRVSAPARARSARSGRSAALESASREQLTTSAARYAVGPERWIT